MWVKDKLDATGNDRNAPPPGSDAFVQRWPVQAPTSFCITRGARVLGGLVRDAWEDFLKMVNVEDRK